jgi:hypothetical protein
MRVGGDAGDIIDGDVGDDGRQVAVGKGNRQTDYSNRINIYNDEEKLHRSRLSLEDRVMDLERLVYGESKWSEPGLIKRQQVHQRISQWNMVVNIAMFLLMLIYLVWR